MTDKTLKEAAYYESRGDGRVECLLCPVGCVIGHGQSGFCKIRHNRYGVLYAEHYGKITSAALDPIEKKPLYHFNKGSMILSIGGYSCNLRCPFCQNHAISMGSPAEEDLSPEAAARLASRLIPKGNIGIAYTYNEPFINYEFFKDTAKYVHSAGLKNVAVTNGYVNIEPLREILPYIDAFNIDLKAFNDRFYSIIKGRLASVKDVIKEVAGKSHVEVTTLVIPGENDAPSEIEEMSRWLASLNEEIPLHLTRFFPNYQMADKRPTPVEALRELANIAKKYLRFVYIGNV